MSATAGGSPGTPSSVGGALSASAALSCSQVSAGYGGWPVSVSKSSTPERVDVGGRLGRRAVQPLRRHVRRGAEGAAVLVLVRRADPGGDAEVEHLRARSAVIITLAGVMSRCTMPSRCAAASASATWAPISTASGQGSGPSVSRCSSSSPLSSSITTNEVIEPSGATVSP